MDYFHQINSNGMEKKSITIIIILSLSVLISQVNLHDDNRLIGAGVGGSGREGRKKRKIIDKRIKAK